MAASHEQADLQKIIHDLKKAGYWIELSEIQLGKAIGKGAAGHTYLAKYKGRHVAVKKYSQEILMNDLPSVINEMRFMLELEHPNIVPFEGVVLQENPAKVMLVSTYAKNGDLLSAIHISKVLAGEPLDVKVNLAMGIAKGLAHVHKLGIIHRDIKSANILLSDKMTPWLADFGFSRMIDRVNTMTGETGSYRYMAPEVIKASKYTDKADVYSFSVCMCELFTGKQPFAGTHPFQAARGVALNGARPDYKAIPNVTLQRLIRACWQKDETRRPSWDLIHGVLQEVLDDLAAEKGGGNSSTAGAQQDAAPSPATKETTAAPTGTTQAPRNQRDDKSSAQPAANRAPLSAPETTAPVRRAPPAHTQNDKRREKPAEVKAARGGFLRMFRK